MRKAKKIVLALPLLLNKMVKRTNWYQNKLLDKSNYPDNEWYRNHLERNYDVVNLGSSSGVYDFDYTGLNVKAFNWALQPQSLEFSFKILKTYFSILKQKGIVIIPFSPFSGLSVTGKWAETAYDKYYNILDETMIDNYEAVRRRHIYPLFTSPKIALKKLLKDDPRIKTSRICSKCTTNQEYEKDSQRWMNIWQKEFGISNLNAPLSDENKLGATTRKQLLSEMIEFCLVRNLRPVLVMAPVHPTLTSKLTKEFRENYIYSFIREVKPQNVPFLDYLDDSRFLESKDFDNSFFLSIDGARKFTKIVLEDIGV